eukprot:scaffold1778_cov135-Skeletonema_menzelii.AAC.4
MSMKTSAARDDLYVIVKTTYPTTYGCYRGQSWSKSEMICRSDVDISSEKYDSYEEAVDAAREMRDNSEWFTDYEPEDDEEDLPPYDSAVMENWDNDEEVLIRVMKESEYYEERAEDQEYLERVREKAMFEAALKSEMIKLQVEDSGGKVFYSHLYPDCQIPAEFEFDESKKDADSSFALPTNAGETKSIMFKIDHKVSENVFRGDDAVLQGSDLMKLLVACTSLEELYLRSSGFQTSIDSRFFEGIAAEAPHLCQTLKVLSISGLELPPLSLKAICKNFPNLIRLDASNCFSTNYNDWGLNYNDDPPLPYDEPLLECVGNLPNLKRLDLGHGSQEMQRYLFDYSLKHSTLMEVYRMVKLVTLDDDNMPEPFSSRAREDNARAKAVYEIVENASGKYTHGVVELARKVWVCFLNGDTL